MILELFRAGYSQNDIVSHYNVSVLRTRAVLQNAGEDTSRFRRLSDTAQRVIEVLVRSGIFYCDIEAVCDVSFHAVRDFVVRKGLQGKRGHRVITFSVPANKRFRKRTAFLQGYSDGISFFRMVAALDLTDTEIVLAYRSIKESQIVEHRSNLRLRIEHEHKLGLSQSGIARKLDISRSIVRNFFTCR